MQNVKRYQAPRLIQDFITASMPGSLDAAKQKIANMDGDPNSIDSVERTLRAFQHYVELSKDRAFDATVLGMPAQVLVMADAVIDPMTHPEGKNAYAEGAVLVVLEHPTTHVQSTFLLSDSTSETKRDKAKSIVLSVPDADLIAVIEKILAENKGFKLFQHYGVTNALNLPQPTYHENTLLGLNANLINEPYNQLKIIGFERLSEHLNRAPKYYATYWSSRSLLEFTKNREMSLELASGSNGGFYSHETFKTAELSGALSEQVLNFTSRDNSAVAYTQISQLVDTVKNEKQAWLDDFAQRVNGRRYAILRDTGLNFDPNNLNDGRIDPHLYPDGVVDFILSADTRQKQAHRKTFIDDFYKKIYQNLLLASVALSDARERKFMTHALMDIFSATRKGQRFMRRTSGTVEAVVLPSAIDTIDRGEFPKEAICHLVGLPVMSNKEFDYGMRIFGADGIFNTRSGKIGYGVDLFRNSQAWQPEADVTIAALTRALAIAKLPEPWLKDDPDKNLPYCFDHMRAIYPLQDIVDRDEQQEMWNKVKAIQSAVTPYLVNAGKAIANAQNIQDEAERALALSTISKKMAWLSKRDGSVIECLLKLDKKFKIEATYRDYAKLITQLSEAYYFRLFADSDIKGKEDIFSIGSHFDFSINDRRATELFFEHFDAQQEPEYDEDAEEYIDPIPASEMFSKVVTPGERDVANWLVTNQYALKDTLSLNNELHKAYNKIIRELNNFSSKNFEWGKLTDTPFVYTDANGQTVTISTINTRLDLLEEGNAMSHCVFSYISKCMAGESIILSIRNEQDERLATVELSIESDGHDEDELPTFSLEQCFAHHNTRAPDVAQDAINVMLEQLNERELTFNTELSVSHEHQSAFDDAMDDPCNEGDIFTVIPFTTDAAYLVEEIIDRFLPKGFAFRDYLMEKSGCVSEIYYHSQFGRNMTALNEMKKAYDLSAQDLVSLKNQLELIDMQVMKNFLVELKPFHEMVSNFTQKLSALSLTPAQISREIMNSQELNDLLANLTARKNIYGNIHSSPHSPRSVVFNSDTLTALIEKGGDIPGFGDFLRTCPISMPKANSIVSPHLDRQVEMQRRMTR